MKNPKLEPWLIEGIKRVAYGGISALNVSLMAEEIKINKSSFYHYFNTKEEYLKQLLEYWEEVGTLSIVRKFLLKPDQKRPVYLLINSVFESNFLNECVLQQLRISRNENQLIGKKLDEVDRIRISFMSSLISNQDYSKVESRRIGTLVYKHFLGSLSLCNLSQPNKEERQAIMNEFISLFGEI